MLLFTVESMHWSSRTNLGRPMPIIALIFRFLHGSPCFKEHQFPTHPPIERWRPCFSNLSLAAKPSCSSTTLCFYIKIKISFFYQALVLSKDFFWSRSPCLIKGFFLTTLFFWSNIFLLITFLNRFLLLNGTFLLKRAFLLHQRLLFNQALLLK